MLEPLGAAACSRPIEGAGCSRLTWVGARLAGACSVPGAAVQGGCGSRKAVAMPTTFGAPIGSVRGKKAVAMPLCQLFWRPLRAGSRKKAVRCYANYFWRPLRAGSRRTVAMPTGSRKAVAMPTTFGAPSGRFAERKRLLCQLLLARRSPFDPSCRRSPQATPANPSRFAVRIPLNFGTRSDDLGIRSGALGRPIGPVRGRRLLCQLLLARRSPLFTPSEPCEPEAVRGKRLLCQLLLASPSGRCAENGRYANRFAESGCYALIVDRWQAVILQLAKQR